jgi:hypothetical protein
MNEDREHGAALIAQAALSTQRISPILRRAIFCKLLNQPLALSSLTEKADRSAVERFIAEGILEEDGENLQLSAEADGEIGECLERLYDVRDFDHDHLGIVDLAGRNWNFETLEFWTAHGLL